MRHNWFFTSLHTSDHLRGETASSPSIQPGSIIRPYESGLNLVKRIIDGAFVIFSLVLVCSLYSQVCNDQYVVVAVSAALLFSVASKLNHLYACARYRLVSQEISPLLRTWFSVIAGLLIMGYMFKITQDYSRVVMGVWFLTTPVVLFLWRLLLKSGLGYFRSRGYNSRSAVIVGTGKCAQQLANNIRRMNWTGLNFQGLFHADIHDESVETIGGLDKLYEMRDCHEVDVVYIALPMSQQKQIDDILEELSDSTISIFLVPDFDLSSIAQGEWVTVGDTPTVSVIETPILGANAGLKRFEDILVSTIAVIITAPIMAVIAIAIKLDSKGPVFYQQSRHGLDGKEISVWKFRSMSVMEQDYEFKQATKGDERITRVGAFLRKTSLDELPQFFNVLSGKMSVVGPRPHALAHNTQYRKSIHGYMQRHKVKPGLTGLAQINDCRGETETKQKMEQRVKYDMEYLNKWSIWLDMKIILITPFVLLKGENAY